jgi:hypothetical protein
VGFWRQARRKFGILGEFWGFLKTNKKWWLAPIIILLLVLTAIIVLTTNPALAPFIYPILW